MTTADEFEAEYGSPVFQTTFQAFAEGLDGNGILDAGDLAVTAGSNANALDVAATTTGVLYGGTVYTYGGATNVLTLSDNTSGSDRWDLIYFDTGTTSPGKREGTPATKPDLPQLQAGEVPLAAVYVADGQTDVTDSEIRSLRVHAADASETYVEDSPGLYSGDTVESALTSELQYAAQLTGYPLPLADLNAPYAPASIASVNGYPFLNSDLANSSLTVTAGTALSGGGAVGLGGTTTLDVSGVTTSEITDGTLLDADIDAATTIARGKLDQNRTASTVSTNTTTSDEEILFVDTSGGAVTITLASADAVNGNHIIIVDSGGAVETNAVTIDTEGSETIDGGSSVTLETNYGAQVLSSDGTNWFTAGGGSGGGGLDRTTDFDHSGSKSSLSSGNQAIVGICDLDAAETLEIYKAQLLKPDGTASSTSVNLELVTLDNAGGFTSQSVIIAGDGATVYDDQTGTPLASFSPGSNDTTVAVLVDNASASAEGVYAEAKGEVV